MAINWELAKVYFEDLSSMAKTFGGEVTFRDILLIPGVFGEASPQMEDQLPMVQQAVRQAIEVFLKARAERGNRP